MKIVLTGATGFVGRSMAAALLSRGDQLVVLSRHSARARSLVPGATAYHDWVAEKDVPPAAAFEGVDAVIHLAGESIAAQRWSPEQKARIRNSRLNGTRNLVKALAGTSVKTLVSASAIGYYGDRKDERLEEEAAPGNDFLAEVCQGWEREALAARELGIRVVTPRIGVVLGEGGGALDKMLIPFRLGLGGPLGSGRQWMAWIHRDDLVGIILHALDHIEVTGPVNATAPGAVQNSEFTRVLGKVLGRPAFMPVPGFGLRILMGELADALLLGGQHVVPARAIAAGYTFRHPRLEEALAEVIGGRKGSP